MTAFIIGGALLGFSLGQNSWCQISFKTTLFLKCILYILSFILQVGAHTLEILWPGGGPKCKISVYALKNVRHYSFRPPGVRMRY